MKNMIIDEINRDEAIEPRLIVWQSETDRRVDLEINYGISVKYADILIMCCSRNPGKGTETW